MIGQSGAVRPEHFAIVVASKRSNFFEIGDFGADVVEVVG